MARIKYVLSERRRAAIEAGQILAREKGPDDQREVPDFTPEEVALPPLPLHPSVKTTRKRSAPITAHQVSEVSP